MNRATLAMRLKGALTGWRAPMLGFGSTHGEGWIPKEWDWNFWQEGKDPVFMACCSAVEAAVSAYAQTVAMLPGTVWRKLENGGREELPSSQLARILQKPNDYQTRSDFLLNQVRALYFTGNCYAIAERNNQDRVVALHPVHPQHVAPYINRETNDIFWSIAPSDLTPQNGQWPLDGSRLIPDEYVWHVALATPYSPLCGVTPLTSACLSMAANCNLNKQMLAFLANASRPSGTLNTDLKMTKDGVDELRARWKEHSTGAGIGGTPILTHGLKWNPLELSSPDAQLIEFYKLTIADIARALRVPLPLIGVMDGATFNNSEVLMQFWKASGLGFLLEHLELSLDKFFNLPAGTYCELDADALLRSEFKNRVDGLVRGVQGGIFSPNEARRMEGLPAVAEGDMPRVQQQLVPLDYEPRKPTR
jgi:HK97 family phage portal protein